MEERKRLAEDKFKNIAGQRWILRTFTSRRNSMTSAEFTLWGSSCVIQLRFQNRRVGRLVG